MPEPEKKRWNSLEVAKLAVGLLTPIVVAWYGNQLSTTQQTTAEKAAKATQQATEEQQSQALAADISRAIFERRYRAVMLNSALRRATPRRTDAISAEVVERKRLYDESEVSWNTNLEANLFKVRHILLKNDYSDFEEIFEFRLSSDIFGSIDDCLTDAYDSYVHGHNAVPKLDKCAMPDMLIKASDCGYTVSDVLFQYAGKSISEADGVNSMKTACQPLDNMNHAVEHH